jgi:hypothetical protein
VSRVCVECRRRLSCACAREWSTSSGRSGRVRVRRPRRVSASAFRLPEVLVPGGVPVVDAIARRMIAIKYGYRRGIALAAALEPNDRITKPAEVYRTRDRTSQIGLFPSAIASSVAFGLRFAEFGYIRIYSKIRVPPWPWPCPSPPRLPRPLPLGGPRFRAGTGIGVLVQKSMLTRQNHAETAPVLT